MSQELKRVMIAAPRSGGGKTMLTCGLLQLFCNRGLDPAAFKCGPDYIDPLFHRRIVGAKSGNLDLFFTDKKTLCSLLVKGSQGCGIALLEGVMGYYDGMYAASPEGSSYDVARVTGTPVILTVDARGASLSLAALIQGFAGFQADANIQGVILNRCSTSLFAYLAPFLEEQTGIPLLGYVPEDERFEIKSRHLGLVSADEIVDLKEKMQYLAETLAQTIDIEKVLEIAARSKPLSAQPYESTPVAFERVRLGIARDRAFSFYYEENLRMLEEMGVDLVEFSPLDDASLPVDIQGLYLGGGYPELFCHELSRNESMRQSIRQAVEAGMPTIAECGGFMYLQEGICDSDGACWPMTGVLPGTSSNQGKLKHFGYITLGALRDNLYCDKGENIQAHEFHYWHSTYNGTDFFAQKPKRDTGWQGVVARETLVAGFPHIYFPANEGFAARFVKALMAYDKERL